MKNCATKKFSAPNAGREGSTCVGEQTALKKEDPQRRFRYRAPALMAGRPRETPGAHGGRKTSMELRNKTMK